MLRARVGGNYRTPFPSPRRALRAQELEESWCLDNDGQADIGEECLQESWCLENEEQAEIAEEEQIKPRTTRQRG